MTSRRQIRGTAPRGRSPVREGWREKHFEEWFLRDPHLPGGEKLLVVSRARSLARVVDLVCLDANGGLVLLEVKNETTTRAVIGQAIEYLSQYQGVTKIDLDEDFSHLDGAEGGLDQAFSVRFDGALCPEISERRRVFIVGPQFDPPTGVAVQYLSGALAGEVEFGLIRAVRKGRRFQIEFLPPPPWRKVSELEGRFAQTIRGRLIYVLPKPFAPLCWHVGRQVDGGLRLPVGPALNKRVLRPRSGFLLEVDPHPMVNVDGFGRGFGHRRLGNYAVELGIVTVPIAKNPTQQYRISAVFNPEGDFLRFQKTRLERTERFWTFDNDDQRERLHSARVRSVAAPRSVARRPVRRR